MRFLYDYQNEPAERFMERGNLLCALDTGGGKTAISIACAEELMEIGKVNRVLIVCPTGLKDQWAQALAKFTSLPTRQKKVKSETIQIAASPGCVVIDGTPAQKRDQYKDALGPDCEYVICGYDNVVDEWRSVRRLGAGMVVLDEATAIKAFGSERSKHFKSRVNPPYRLALTATPIDNKPEEVYSIMQWVDSDVLGDADMFELAYIERDYVGRVTGYKNLDVLHKKLEPALFRLSINDPELDVHLPDREYVTWTVPIGGQTRALYNAMGWQLVDAIDNLMPGAGFDLGDYYAGRKKNVSGSAGKVAGLHTVLEMFLDSPGLVSISAKKYRESNGLHGSKTAVDWSNDMWGLSPAKLNYLDDKLWHVFDSPDSKVIIFTQYKEMVDQLAYRLSESIMTDYAIVTYHGSMTKIARAEAKAKFQQDPDCRVFISSDAGGVGVDLPQANWLINYDIPWSYGAAHQRNGRHIRVSSEHELVHVVNMVCERTIEQRKLEQVLFKEEVSDAVLDGKMAVSGKLQNDVSTLRQWLVDSLDPRV
jgi:SNF2 family DNA or RNA helicase